jgi:acyl-CoA thioester hydrolase
MIHKIRVIFGDTDQMGVVYYANYLRFFEAARAAYWRALGKSYRDLETAQVALPVVEAHCKYRRPAYYEDLLTIDIEITELRAASMVFSYAVQRNAEPLADGWTRHAVVGTDGRPRALPADLRATLLVRPTSPPD